MTTASHSTSTTWLHDRSRAQLASLTSASRFSPPAPSDSSQVSPPTTTRALNAADNWLHLGLGLGMVVLGAAFWRDERFAVPGRVRADDLGPAR